MSVLLHVSDPHFGTEQPAVMAALLQLAEHCRPDLVVLSGDITQRARRRQFAAARAYFQRMPAPLLAIPGNHDLPLFDLPRRMLAPYARYRDAFGEDEPAWDGADWLVLGVNTTRPWRHKDGEISAAQIERICQSLGRAKPAQVRVVVVHQPMAITRPEDERNLLHGHAAAARAWSEAGADIVLGGHIHLPYIRALEPVPGRLWVVQAGTAVSTRVRGTLPNSVNVLRQERRGDCVVERWDYLAEAEAFTCHHARTLRLR